MTRRTAVRTAIRAAVLVLAGAPLLAVAPAAFASGSITTPTSDGAVYTDGGSLNAAAKINANTAPTTLSLSGPGYAKTSKSVNRDVVNDQTMSLSAPTGDGESVTNGKWTVTLSGGVTATRTFWSSFPAAQPDGFSASGSGSRQVTFTWDKGSEPDLTGYTLYEGDNVVQDGIDPADYCSGSTCTFGLYYPSDMPGEHDYALVAHRPGGGCPGCDDTLTSSRATSSATLDQPPPAPSPSPSTGSGDGTGSGTGGTQTGGGTDPGTGGTDNGSGGTTNQGGTTNGTNNGTNNGGTTNQGGTQGGTSNGGTNGGGSTSNSGGTLVGGTGNSGSLSFTPTQRRDFALGYNSFGPSLGIPKLPPLVATQPQASGEATLPFGTYKSTLPYTAAKKKSGSAPARALGSVGSAVTSVIDADRLVRSIAGALVLLLMFAHLRRFLHVTGEE